MHGRERKERKLKKKLIELNEEINIGRNEKNVGERKEVNRDLKKKKVNWSSVGAEKLMWHILEKPKKFLLASGFNL